MVILILRRKFSMTYEKLYFIVGLLFSATKVIYLNKVFLCCIYGALAEKRKYLH